MHVILDDLRAEGREGVEWECVQEQEWDWERGWTGDGCALTATRQTRRSILSLLPLCISLSVHLYLRLAARTVSSASQTHLPACKAQAQAQTGRHIAHTNTHATLQSSAPILAAAP